MEKYNGWQNYQTWLCKVWIDNDFNTYQHYKQKAKQAKSISDLSQLLEKDFTQKAYDLMQNAINKIYFHEIAEILINE